MHTTKKQLVMRSEMSNSSSNTHCTMLPISSSSYRASHLTSNSCYQTNQISESCNGRTHAWIWAHMARCCELNLRSQSATKSLCLPTQAFADHFFLLTRLHAGRGLSPNPSTRRQSLSPCLVTACLALRRRNQWHSPLMMLELLPCWTMVL